MNFHTMNSDDKIARSEAASLRSENGAGQSHPIRGQVGLDYEYI